MDVLAGVAPDEIVKRPLPPYDTLVCEFLNEWGKTLRVHPQGRRYGDVVSFAFFCRRANIAKLKNEEDIRGYHIGRGLCFHIAPSNIPVNFAFTYVFGLLAGNANVVRISSKQFAQVDILCETIETLFENEKYDRIRRMTSFIRYGHSSDMTQLLSAKCDIRIIWGGDNTIRTIRNAQIPPQSIEITFSNRYSIACINGQAIRDASDEDMKRLAEGFYNDTYLMDQNACSSPQMIYWMDAKPDDKERFWQTVLASVRDYEVSEFAASEKYTMACNDAIAQKGVGKLRTYGNKLYVISLPKKWRGSDTDIEDEDTSKAQVDSGDTNDTTNNVHEKNQVISSACLGEFGLFCEQDIDDFDEILCTASTIVQTCTYYGIDKEKLVSKIIESGTTGIDRVVPIGKALDISVYWDGYDLIRQMSRRIEMY